MNSNPDHDYYVEIPGEPVNAKGGYVSVSTSNETGTVYVTVGSEPGFNADIDSWLGAEITPAQARLLIAALKAALD